jgi:hypothetical protein
MKYTLKGRIICFLIFIPCTPLLIIPILKHVFYAISGMTELIGDVLNHMDMMIAKRIDFAKIHRSFRK